MSSPHSVQHSSLTVQPGSPTPDHPTTNNNFSPVEAGSPRVRPPSLSGTIVNLSSIKTVAATSAAMHGATTQPIHDQLNTALDFSHVRVQVPAQVNSSEHLNATRLEISDLLQPYTSTEKPLVYLHKFSDIDRLWQKPGNEINPNTGFPIVEDGPLKKAVLNGGKIIINENNFSAIQIEAFNNLVERQTFHGVKPHAETRVISLFSTDAKTSSASAKKISGAWFSRLTQINWSEPMQTSLADDEEIFSDARNPETIIDLAFDPQWQQYCQSHWTLDANGTWSIKNPLANKPIGLTVINLPNDPHCRDWMNERGYSIGEAKEIPEIKLFSPSDQITPNTIIYFIDDNNFDSLLGEQAFVNTEGKLALLPSVLRDATQTQPIYLQIHGVLTQHQQYVLAQQQIKHAGSVIVLPKQKSALPTAVNLREIEANERT